MAIVPTLVTELTSYEKFLRLPKIVKVKINGNEIYEGDILRLGNSPSGVCEVKWNTTMAAFCIQFFFERELGTRTLGEWLIFEKEVEVIGNIHDNPELMKIE